MKNIIKYILVISLISLWSFSFADGKITQESKIKVKPQTYWINKGSVNILDNAQFIIEGMLTVEQNLSNSSDYDGLQIKSNAENTGSIIFGEGSPNAQVERYMRAARPHLIGAPVSGETAASLDFNSPTTRLYNYTDGSGYAQITDNTTELVNGNGYYYYIYPTQSGGLTPTFEGQLRANDLVLNINSEPPLEHNARGQNLISNPFSSSIDWENPNLEFNDMEASLWVYDANARRYKYRNNSGYGNLKDGIIPMGQGFMVRTYSQEASLTIPAEARLHQQQDFYKNGDEIYDELNYLVFEIIKDSLADELWVGYQWNSTDEFDNGIDITKMFTFEEEPQLYTSHNNEDFCIDLVEEPAETGKQVPVFLRVGSNGTHQLNLLQFQGFTDVLVELEDLFTGEIMNLADMDSYSFDANVEDEELRFILHFNPAVATGLNSFETREDLVQIYGYDNKIYVKSEGQYESQEKELFIYDLNGKLLSIIPLSSGHLNSINNDYQSNMIIVKAEYVTDSFTEKIVYIK
jgi:hypothetical protein